MANGQTRSLDALAGAADAFRRSGDWAGEARARVELGTRLVILEKLESSVPQLARAADLFEQLGDDWNEARSRFGVAQALCMLGRFEESLAHHARVAELAEALGVEKLWIDVEESWLKALLALQRWDEVVDHCARIVAFTERRHAPELRELEVKAHFHWVQALLTMRGDYLSASSHAQRVAAWAAETGDAETEADMRVLIATALRETERFEEALDQYERLLTLARRLPGYKPMTEVLNGLGSILERSPEVGAARFEELAKQYEASGDSYLEGLCRYWRGRCLDLNRPPNYQVSIEEYRRAGQLLDSSGAERAAGDAYYFAATALNYLALANPSRNEIITEESYALYELAAARFEATENFWGKGVAETGAVNVLRKYDLSDPDDPRRLPMTKRAVRSFSRGGRPVEAANAFLFVAVELAFLDRVDQYLRVTLVALRSYERARSAHLLPHDREESDRKSAQGFDILSSKMLRIAAAKGSDPWWQAALWRIEQATKARSFQDQQTQNAVWNYLLITDPPFREITRKIQDLTRQRDYLRAEIDRDFFDKRIQEVPEKARRRDAIERNLKEAQRVQRKRLKDVVRRRPDTVELVSTTPTTVVELQACLKPGEAYLGFLWASSSIARIFVQPDGACAITTPEASWPGLFDDWLIDAKRRGEFNLANPDEDEKAVIAEIAQELLGDIPNEIDTLIISPHGSLVGIPWHQLPLPGSEYGGDTVGDHYTIGIVPAAGVLVQLRREERVAPEATYLGVACNADPPIPLVDAEVCHIAESYFANDPSARYLTTQNSRELFQMQRSVQLLHLACHASRGGLLLSQDSEWTMPVDLLDLGLRAEILLLTACNAGDFADDDNNEFLGVVRQLLVVTRARAAIVNTRPVPDVAGMVFSDLVLSALTGREVGRPWQPPSESLAVGHAVEWARGQLRQLDKRVIAPFIHKLNPTLAVRPNNPSWWACWFVVGDPSLKVEWITF